MPEVVKSVREIQDECAAVAADLESVAYRLVKMRESLRLPVDSLTIYEEGGVPWPVELAVDAAIGATIDDALGPAAEKLRKAARATNERLRQGFLAQQLRKRREEGEAN